MFKRLSCWLKKSDVPFWVAWTAVALFTVFLIFASAADASEYDQVSYCKFTSLKLCEENGTACEGGDTPEQAHEKLGMEPSAIIPVPNEHSLNGEAHVFVANSGKHIYLEFRDGHLYSAAVDYVAWLDSGTKCGVDL